MLGGLVNRLVGQNEYVTYEASDGVARLLVSQDHLIESQYMRKLIATGLGRAGDWNWRTSPKPRAADAAWRSFVTSVVC